MVFFESYKEVFMKCDLINFKKPSNLAFISHHIRFSTAFYYDCPYFLDDLRKPKFDGKWAEKVKKNILGYKTGETMATRVEDVALNFSSFSDVEPDYLEYGSSSGMQKENFSDYGSSSGIQLLSSAEEGGFTDYGSFSGIQPLLSPSEKEVEESDYDLSHGSGFVDFSSSSFGSGSEQFSGHG